MLNWFLNSALLELFQNEIVAYDFFQASRKKFIL